MRAEEGVLLLLKRSLNRNFKFNFFFFPSLLGRGVWCIIFILELDPSHS